MTNGERLAEAVRCCIKDDCENCPMQDETCDDFYVQTVEIPEKLMTEIEAELEHRKGEKHGN